MDSIPPGTVRGQPPSVAEQAGVLTGQGTADDDTTDVHA